MNRKLITRASALLAALFLIEASASAQEAAPAPSEAAPAAPMSEAPAVPAEAPAAEGSATMETTVATDVSPEAAAATAPSEEVPLSAAELEALGFGTSEGGEVATLDTDLHVSGFMDFNYSRSFAKDGSLNKSFLPRHGNMYVGNFNVYLTKNLSERFRTMGEVRFSYAPNGQLSTVPTTGTATPTTYTKDYADYDRLSMKWGGIEIERVYLEYTAHQLLTVRAGQFLTPYGIWNVDHGSPTFIPVTRPYVVGQGLFPERQTGFELFGRWDATANGTLGYHLTISNGSGPISEYRDLDDNKAVGGRLFWEQHGIGDLKIGASAYFGKDTDALSTFKLNAAGGLAETEILTQQYDQLSLAVDASWKYKGLLLQAEYITQQRRYTEAGRRAATNNITQQVVFPADAASSGLYGIVGYRLPWYGVMPYFMVSSISLLDPAGTDSHTTGFNGGLNIRPTDAVVFKLEYSHSWPQEAILGSKDAFKMLQTQVAWAF